MRSAASAETCTGRTMRPRPVCAQMIVALRMPLQQILHLREVDRLGVDLPERHVDVVVQDHDEAGLRRESRIRSSAGLVRLAVSPAIFEETNSLWMLNSPMPVKTPGNVVQHAADVVDAVHVGRD